MTGITSSWNLSLPSSRMIITRICCRIALGHTEARVKLLWLTRPCEFRTSANGLNKSSLRHFKPSADAGTRSLIKAASACLNRAICLLTP